MSEPRERRAIAVTTHGSPSSERRPPAPCVGLALALVGSVLVTPTARADESQPGPSPEARGESGIRAELAAATYVPISLGVDGGVELPRRVLLRLHVGWMPPAYIRLINETATGFGWYDDPTAELVEAAADDAFVLRASVGWRPFRAEGFEALLGYTLLVGMGDVTSSEIVEAATGQPISPRRSSEYELSSTLHALHVMLGWAFRPRPHLVVRAHVGFVYTVAARTTVERGEGGAVPADVLEAYIDDVLETYGFTPELGLAVGWAF